MSEITDQDPIEIAFEHHRAGRLAEAEQIYRQVLARQPDQADALHLLGVIALQVRRGDVAVELIGRAIRQLPDFAVFHASLGKAHGVRADTPAAIASYRRALELDPTLADAHHHL